MHECRPCSGPQPQTQPILKHGRDGEKVHQLWWNSTVNEREKDERKTSRHLEGEKYPPDTLPLNSPLNNTSCKSDREKSRENLCVCAYKLLYAHINIFIYMRINTWKIWTYVYVVGWKGKHHISLVSTAGRSMMTSNAHLFGGQRNSKI